MKNLPQITAILKLIASCRLQFQMMSSVSEMLEAINRVNNNRKAMEEWKKQNPQRKCKCRKKKSNLKRTLAIGIQMCAGLEPAVNGHDRIQFAVVSSGVLEALFLSVGSEVEQGISKIKHTFWNNTLLRFVFPYNSQHLTIQT